MLIFVLWILSHLIYSINFAYKNRFIRITAINLLLASYVLLEFRPPTFDLINYVAFFAYPNPEEFEYGFYILAFLLKLVTNDEIYSILVVKFLILTFVLLSVKIFNRVNFSFYMMTIVLLSMYTFLATQNILRQGLMLPFVIISTHNFFHRNQIFGLITSLIGISIHKSFLLFIFMFSLPIYITKKFHNKIAKYLCFIVPCLIGLIFSIVFTIDNYSLIGDLYLTDEDYSEGRTSFTLKYILTFIFFMITHMLFSNSKKNDSIKLLLNIRAFNYIFLFSLVFFPEFFSRYMIFCYLIDILIIVQNRIQDKYYRTACALIIIAYSFSPQIFNIITGVYN